MVFVESVLERIGETLTSGLKALTSSLRAMVDEGDGASPLGALVDDHLAIVAAGTATPAAAVIEALRSVRSCLVEKLDALMQVGRCVSFLIAQIIPGSCDFQNAIEKLINFSFDCIVFFFHVHYRT